MNQRLKGRKRRIVSGTVSQIKKQESLGVKSVGNRVDVITNIIKRRKDNSENGQ